MDNTFKVDDKEYKIIKILAPSNSMNRYIVYTDDTNELYASRYEIVDDNIVLKDIDTESEWKYINERMAEIDNGK